MKVAVLGSNGLIGRAVCALLEKRGDEVIQSDQAHHLSVKLPRHADLRRAPDAWNAMMVADHNFIHQKVDAVVHLAGKRASVAVQHEQAADLLLGNLAIDSAVFNAARSLKIPKLVYASTVSVYGRHLWRCSKCKQEFFEPLCHVVPGTDPRFDVECADSSDSVWEPIGFRETEVGLPDDSVRYSAWGKLTAERMIEAVNLQDKLDWSVVRLVNTYGPHDHFGPDALVIPSLIRRMIEDPKTPLQVAGWGNERDFLYVDDAAAGIVAALDHPVAGVWNLGTGEGRRIGEVANLVAKACGFPSHRVERHFADEHLGGAQRKVVDPSRAKEELGWQAEVTLVDGIARTVEWYRNFVGGRS